VQGDPGIRIKKRREGRKKGNRRTERKEKGKKKTGRNRQRI